jgi:hypothetical protein
MIGMYLTVDDASTAFAEATQNIATTLVPQVFSSVTLANPDLVSEELFYLAVYVLDGLIKNPVNASWATNCETIAKSYYSKCAAILGNDHWTFAANFLERASFYNAAMAKHIEIASLPNRDDRIAKIAELAGRLFAERCGAPDDTNHALIGASACTTLNLTTERFFSSQLVA